MKRLKSIVLAAFAAVMAIALVPSLPVEAAGSAALSIVPKKNYIVEPGKSIKDTLVIRNLDEKETLNLTLRVVDFTFTDDGGTPKLMLAEDAQPTTWSLKPFMTVPKNVIIEPKQSKTVDMSVAIPAGHGGGSYYSAIVYSSGSSEGGNVGLSASGVTLAFVNVPGDVNEDLKLEKFGAYNLAKGNRKAGYAFVTAEKPETIAYTLKNNGNVTESPVGSITIKPLFGAPKTIDNVNPNQSLALIGQSRTFTSCIQLKSEDIKFDGNTTRSTACTTPDLWPGFYKLDLNLFYGQNGNRTQDIVSSSWFIYLPVWFIIVMLVLLAIIGFFIYRLVGKIRGGSKKKKSHRK